MKRIKTHILRRCFAFLMAAIVLAGTAITSPMTAHAADGTLNFQTGELISYGDYYTTKMSVDNNGTAYCVQPMKKTPAAGSYQYDLLGKDSALRKALYYLPGGYGYEEQNIAGTYLSGWSENDRYVIGHLVASYVYSNYDAGSGAFYGAPQSYIDKAVEIANAIQGLPAPPDSFRAFIIPSDSNQTVAGCWYEKPYGWIEIQKSTANSSVSDGNGNYSLKGAQYGIYQGSNLVETLTTDENGYAKSGDLEVGSYTIKELSPSPGYALDTNAYDVTVSSGETAKADVKEIPQNNPLSLVLQKLDADLKDAIPQGAASLKDAEFTVKFYTTISDTDPAAGGSEPARTWVFRTGEDGKISFTEEYKVSGDEFYYASDGKTLCVPLGTVTIQETKAPAGYQLNETVFVLPISSSGTEETVSAYQAPDVPDAVIRGGVKVQKRDLETGGTTPQGSATLEGAEFAITSLNENPVVVDGTTYQKDEVVLTIKTDASGLASTAADALPYGSYRVDEVTPPTGYLGEGTLSAEFTISKNGEMVDLTGEDSSISNQIIRGGVKVQKRDIETGEAAAQGGATLEGAEFTITSLNANPVIVDGETYENGEIVLTLVTDEKGLASTAKDALPYGHYRVDETKAPKGYLNEGRISLEFDITEDGKIVELTETGSSIENQVIRGDLELVKVSDGDLSRLAGVPFTITSKTTGESHTIVTDKNGYASTSAEWNKHTSNTNRGETAEDGIWFGTSEPDDSKGALIYDTYTIEEQRCEANEGRNLLTFDVEVYRDSVTIDLGTLTNDKVEIATTALDKESGSHMAKPDDKVTIVDTVEYEGLKKGVEYRVVGTLMNKETGEPFEIDGKPVTAETTFTAKKSTGSVEVEFTFDATGLGGTTVVCFEELWQDDLKMAVHADIEDQDQSIFFPEIGTQVKDSETGLQMAHADEEVTLIDTVSYSNVPAGEELTLQGILMDKETGEALEIDGETVTSELTFTPESTEGTVDVEFTFNATEAAGKTLVVFESLYYGEEEIASHQDLSSPEQTLVLPSVSTTAANPELGNQTGLAKAEASITDVAEYTNLIAGETFTIRGTLMDQETGEELLIDEKPVTAEAEFTPEETSGTTELTFTFNAEALAGKTLVVFEEILYKDQVVASHRDISSDPQSIYFPQIGTSATDGEDGDQEILADSEVTIKDTVSYENLIPGASYLLKGVLMDQETGEELLLDGNPVTAETAFTPEERSGSVEVVFTLDGSSLAGKSLVVFETLYYVDADGTQREICSHKDIDDAGQTVHLSENPPEVPEEPTETPSVSNPVKTGDDAPILLYLGIGAGALVLAGALTVLYLHRRKQKDNQ